MNFELSNKFKPCGDQITAIKKLTQGLKDGLKSQVLLGVTGSGKTFTMANIIANINKPCIVIAHNKTLAFQLCNEFKDFFPNNRVEFFVSYYDYYQPEAYIPSTDTYIEKDLDINEEIDKLRNSATCSLAERKDTIVVSSVSCIYGLGAPLEYFKLVISLREGSIIYREKFISHLIDINYKRNDIERARNNFRVNGDVVDVFISSSSSKGVRIEFFGDEVENIYEIDSVSGQVLNKLSHVAIFPATHFTYSKDSMQQKFELIKQDMYQREEEFQKAGKLIEAQRIRERVTYDLEFLKEFGYCKGIENYSRYFDGRNKGEPPFCLLDYFPNDYIMFIDESHMTIPQIRGMERGDFARKDNLVKYGFRLESAYDNRPLTFEEFYNKTNQIIYVSATPGKFELETSNGEIVEQIIRPTGLLDPKVIVKSTVNQIENLIVEIKKIIGNNGRVLVTTLTKKMAESLTKFLIERNIKACYMHSENTTMERAEIITKLRKGEFYVLVGINLLREGLDIPETQLVAIMDADKEGFLRSESSLVQTIGRAARNVDGHVIMFADNITGSMQRAISETERRRKIQMEYNLKHNITPQSIKKDIHSSLSITKKSLEKIDNFEEKIEEVTSLMKKAGDALDFEAAIIYREKLKELEKLKKKYNKQKY